MTESRHRWAQPVLEGLVDFSPRRAQGGYRLEPAEDPKQFPHIVPAGAPPKDINAWLESPPGATRAEARAHIEGRVKSWIALAPGIPLPRDLYLQIANCAPHPDEGVDLGWLYERFLAFANKYGLLGDNEFDESVREWVATWAALWSAIGAMERGDPNAPILMMKIINPSPAVKMLLGTESRVTSYSLLEGLNKALEDAPLQAVIESENPLTFVARVRPRNLRAFLWTQLLQDRVNHSYQRCQQCGNWMLAFKGATRARNTCSDKCRVQLHLKRQARAVELHRTGKSIKEIADQLRAEGWQPAGSQSGARQPRKPEQQIRAWVGAKAKS